MRKKRLWCLSWRIQLDFSKRGTIDSSSSSIFAAIEVFCESQEYKIPHMVNQHQYMVFFYLAHMEEEGGLDLFSDDRTVSAEDWEESKVHSRFIQSIVNLDEGFVGGVEE